MTKQDRGTDDAQDVTQHPHFKGLSVRWVASIQLYGVRQRLLSPPRGYRRPAAVGRQCDGASRCVLLAEQVDRERPERPSPRDEADGLRRPATRAWGHPLRRQRSGSLPEIRQLLPNQLGAESLRW